MSKKSTFWLLFNWLGKLLGGCLFIGGGLMEVAYLVSFLDKNSSIYSQTTGVVDRTFLLIFPIILMVLGWLIIKSKPFKPW